MSFFFYFTFIVAILLENVQERVFECVAETRHQRRSRQVAELSYRFYIFTNHKVRRKMPVRRQPNVTTVLNLLPSNYCQYYFSFEQRIFISCK